MLPARCLHGKCEPGYIALVNPVFMALRRWCGGKPGD
jgi:hypothetical protein